MTGIEIAVWESEADADILQVAALIRSGLDACGVSPISLHTSETLEALEMQFAQHPPATMLLLYPSAEFAVARGLAREQRPSESLTQWKSQMDRLLVLCRRHRKNIVLASLAEAARAPLGCLKALNAHIQLFDPAQLPPAPALKGSEMAGADWQIVLARQTVSLDATARRIDGELEAMALPLERVTANPDKACAELQAIAAKVHDDAVWQAERSLLHSQLSMVQQELTEQFSSAARKDEEADRARRGQAEVENRMMQEQERCAALTGELEQTRARLQEAEQGVQALLGSTSWKMTEPLRGVVRVLTGRGRSND